jgi:hypothetical protein
MESQPDWLEYFSGGVPTGLYFRMTLDDLRKVSALQDGDSPGINRLQELCFIGLVSYFEAFCKDHFASLINLEPSLVANLKANGQDVSIDAAHVTLYADEIDRRLGFVLAEKYDFGTAQKINALFGALLKVTPFGRDEAKKYAGLLQDRNLLVHHGGTLTLTYLEQSVGSRSVSEGRRSSTLGVRAERKCLPRSRSSKTLPGSCFGHLLMLSFAISQTVETPIPVNGKRHSTQ